MIWPFSKKTKTPPLEIPPVDAQRWAVAQGDYGGAPLLLRFNETAKSVAGHPELPVKLGFAVPLVRPNEGGLPDPEENRTLDAIEDLVADRVLGSARALHAMTITNGLMKEFVFYVVPGLDIAALHAALRAEVTSHDLQCMAIHEPGWESFRAIVPE